MSKEDIEKAVKEAEKFAEEDKKFKEAVEAKNNAENMIFQIEKSMGDLGDKITDGEKAPVNEAITKLKATIATGDTEAIKADTEALQKAFYPLAEKLYQQAQGADNGAGAADDANAGGDVYGADFEDKT